MGSGVVSAGNQWLAKEHPVELQTTEVFRFGKHVSFSGQLLSAGIENNSLKIARLSVSAIERNIVLVASLRLSRGKAWLCKDSSRLFQYDLG
ncbi:MAG: hypothetical protein ACK59A_07995 [Cyanobacteriota bacterium]|jgi:hypothetical protein